MAGSKEIRNKIKSIKNTQKITRAMEMVAASKMRKAQDRMRKSRPYTEKIRSVIGHLAQAHPDYKHPFMVERPAKRIGVVVVSSDRGLCGGLNTNLFKATLSALKKWQAEGVEIDVCPIGNKGSGFFKRIGSNIVAQATHLGDTPSLEDLIGLVKVMLDAYNSGTIDRLYVIYNRFVNTMTQAPQVQQLLPIHAGEGDKLERYSWDYLYEPSAPEVVDALLMRYIESLVYQGVVENIACEQAARMVAMKSASDNAGNLINELQLVYNKARQAAITQEISEIVAGAAAV
ncbi:ATP synthase, F1 gamma subunit [Beggiatoa alba B18LD]|uniref:ATP synthase gamma chain n=1 Tax=Beggiatoa alba B18LD TaxID=395493 RepID=I3CK14_9GAMM|nr:F0F1 ATP synthase subunit gamma [Beggiatoa alba]EIJ43957.1 ATP synthase, F1 gamma subunit [Beggiatoa alba B18LD]